MGTHSTHIRIIRTSTATTVVSIPCHGDFPFKRRFVMQPNIIEVEVKEARKRLYFRLTLRSSDKAACRTQLNRILPPLAISKILNATEDCTIEVSEHTIIAASRALRQIGKFPYSGDSDQNPGPRPESIIPGAIGKTIIAQRRVQETLASLADQDGIIRARKLPRPPSPFNTGGHQQLG